MTEINDLNAPSVPVNQAQTEQPQDPYAEVSLPENSSLNAQGLAALKQAACEVNLPVAALQKWVSLEENRSQSLAEKATQQNREQLENWARQTQQAFGPAWQEEVSKAVRAADVFGGPELRKLLEETGLGNHPVMVRTFHTVATRICEDVSAGGAASATTDKTFTQALYGKN